MTKRCFVVQGFGKKTDYEQGKQFDLDASYEVIKEAVEDAGLECFRADELRRNAVIDQVMYEQLLTADLVVADITTLNFNVAYELGVRLALRPHGTLVVGEQGINFPFDINHIYIHPYQHLGDDIGRREAIRFQGELKKLVQLATADAKKDSPVYTFLPQLPEHGLLPAVAPAELERQPSTAGESLRDVVEQAKTAMQQSRFAEAAQYWRKARELSKKDDYLVQQLALATYKSKQPTPEAALREAQEILGFLQPHRSFDPETLGLWAAVHKRLYEISGATTDLNEALFALERGFFIKRDYYNGINLAFMLDTKADAGPTAEKGELQAVARYVRRKVVDICHESRQAEGLTEDEVYWILATLYEASVGLGDDAEVTKWKAESEKAARHDWMNETTRDQIAKLRALLS
jgi:tetratricopeptide (TPR) repeat protein